MAKSTVGLKFTAILQTKVDSKRNIWLCARDLFNSGNPVYVSAVPKGKRTGDKITAQVVDEMGTTFYIEEEIQE
jgi:hypothetical protein